MPLGLMAMGVLIDRVGYAPTVSVGCALGLVFTVVIGARWNGRRAALRPLNMGAPQLRTPKPPPASRSV
jgi:hypothetical protein